MYRGAEVTGENCIGKNYLQLSKYKSKADRHYHTQTFHLKDKNKWRHFMRILWKRRRTGRNKPGKVFRSFIPNRMGKRRYIRMQTF